jgi:hypothetical protein
MREPYGHIAEVHLGPAECELPGYLADGESGAQVALGRSKLASRAKEIPPPLQCPSVSDEVAGVLETPNGESEQDFRGIGLTHAIQFAPEDVVCDAFDAGRVRASREDQGGIGEGTGARRSAREHELGAVGEGERAVGDIVDGKETRRTVEQAKPRVDALRPATYQRESRHCAACGAAISRHRPLGRRQGEQ